MISPDAAEPDDPEIDFAPSKAELAFLEKKIEEYSEQQIGRNDLKPIEMVLRDQDGNVIAGLKGLTVFDWLYVGTLWVDAKHRGTGIGTRLLTTAEATAKRRGCIGACLTSFDFQAPDFYRRHGYQRVGEIKDYPVGGSLTFFSKRLEP